MPRYTIKMNVVIMGLETIVIDSPDEYEVGQTVTITPRENMTVRNQNGNSVSLTPGISITGTVTAKS